MSNFYELPRPLEYEGKTFPTSEHLFQYLKIERYHPGHPTLDDIRCAATPHEAKELAHDKDVVPINGEDWDTVKRDVMLRVLKVKYAIPEMAYKLKSTGQCRLVEMSPYDTFWGCGLSKSSPVAYKIMNCNMPGRNELGCLLQQVRGEL